MLLFVYGSLKSEGSNKEILKRISKMGDPIPVMTCEKYPMYASTSFFPFLEDQPGIGEYIDGELFEIDEFHIPSLDEYEGVPDLFHRGTIDVEFENFIWKDVVCYFKTGNSTEDELKVKTFLETW